MADKDKLESATASSFGVGRMRPGTVQVTVGKAVTQKSLHELIDRIIHMHGCTACGLGGIDVLIRPQDPRIFESFADIPAVQDVVVFR